MELFDELQQSLADLGQFQKFVAQKMEEDKEFLQRTFWMKGNQSTVLNYLILEHEEKSNNLAAHIEHILHEGANAYSSQPIHLAFQHKKLDLIPPLLNAAFGSDSSKHHGHSTLKEVDLNARDVEGRTLLSRAIEAGDADLLRLVLEKKPNVDQPCQGLQPIHLAVVKNFPEAIHALIDANAQVDNPCWKEKETPLLLAAHYGKIDALAALLARRKNTDGIQNDLEVEDARSFCAIDLLCKRVEEKKNTQDALRGIAMLLCHGAAAPRFEKYRHLLREHRSVLLAAVTAYAEDRPEISLKFVRAAHNKGHYLHEILYADKTWGKAVRHFFGVADEDAFNIEKLVSRAKEKTGFSGSSAQFDKDEGLFADFVKRYDDAIKNVTFYNRYSEMRWKITRGEITCWKEVLDYVKEHPKTRSAKIVKEMTQPDSDIHEVLDDQKLGSMELK